MQVIVQFRWKAIQTDFWDAVKGNHNSLMEVEYTAVKEKNLGTFTTDRLVWCDHLIRFHLIQV